MQHTRLDMMIKGWFVGGFEPTAFSTQACEVAVKKYKAGDYEAPHFHKIATETTLILSGHVKMNNREWKENDIITLSPGETTDFLCLTDVVTVVVKVPGASNDKYVVDPPA